jgi:hypothetical protein
MAADVVTILVRFGIDTPLGLFQDTLSFTEEEFASRDQTAVDAVKQALADTWVAFRTVQIAEEEALLTREGKEAKISELDVKIADLAATKARIEAELDALPAEIKP